MKTIIVSYGPPFFSFCGAILGILTETKAKQANGSKKLTIFGWVAMVIVILSFSIGMFTVTTHLKELEKAKLRQKVFTNHAIKDIYDITRKITGIIALPYRYSGKSKLPEIKTKDEVTAEILKNPFSFRLELIDSKNIQEAFNIPINRPTIGIEKNFGGDLTELIYQLSTEGEEKIQNILDRYKINLGIEIEDALYNIKNSEFLRQCINIKTSNKIQLEKSGQLPTYFQFYNSANGKLFLTHIQNLQDVLNNKFDREIESDEEILKWKMSKKTGVKRQSK